jgi:hypothetical protein
MLMVVLSSAWSLTGGGTQVFALQDVGRGPACQSGHFFLVGLREFNSLMALGSVGST